MHFQVTPSATDSNITDHPQGSSGVYKHQIRVGPATPNGFLFLYLPGHGGHSVAVDSDPSLLFYAADAGYHVIGLEYMNSLGNDKCEECSDCYYAAHSTRMYGHNHSSVINVTKADSILNRLTKLLEWLKANRPANEHWEDFLELSGEPKWSQIVVAGHSLGGGQVALIAMDHVVHRVVMFASVVDAVTTNPPPVVESAQWLHRPHATPIDRYYGFRHVDDPFTGTQVNWKTMGMLGLPTSVDGPGYTGAHQLTSSIPVNDPHGAVVKNEPHYSQVWQYLIKP